MESKLDLIIAQNWALLAIISLFWLSTFLCNLYNMRQNRKAADEPQFGNLWETNQIERLLEESDTMLNAYPNRVDALYFRGKALRRIGHHEEALYYFEKLKEIDPSFREEAIRQIEDIREMTANKSSNTDSEVAGS